MDKKKPRKKKSGGLESLVPLIGEVISATIKLLRKTKEIKKKSKQQVRKVKNNGRQV